MTTKDEALKMALEALGECRRDPRLKYEHPYYDKTITALRQALEQVEQPAIPPSITCPFCESEHVPGWLHDLNMDRSGHPEPEQPEHPPECKTDAEKTAYAFGWFKALEANREQPAYRAVKTFHEGKPVYVAQPHKWVGLTDAEFQWIYDNGRTPAGLMELVEAKLKEKNGF